MKGKGKFIYITGVDKDRIFVKDSAFSYDANTDLAFPLSQFSTSDLLKVKAQIATELENRMDLDEITEQNLSELKAKIRNAPEGVVAQLVRQTLDRIDTVSADEKRAKTRLEILQDELKFRMDSGSVTEMKFAGVISVTYKPETVFGVGEDGWIPVYSNIVAESIEGQIASESVVKQIADDVDVSDSVVFSVANSLMDNIRGGLINAESFALLQKRLTSTTLNDLLKQGCDLPKGIEKTTIRKIKTKRLK